MSYGFSDVKNWVETKKGKPEVYFALANEQFTLQQLIEYGVSAERAGFNGIWTSDHYQPWQDNQGHSGAAWVLLAALTQQVTSIQLGTGVTCPTFRYRPAIVAQIWASLSMLAPGRIYLGLGTGEKFNEAAAGGGWGSYEERTDRLVEAVKIIRELWTGKQVQIEGQFWDIEGKLYDPPALSIPIYIAAGGPKSARLAGLYGDGLITGGNVLKSTPKVKESWEAGVRESGRDPATQSLIVEHWTAIGDESAGREGAKKWRFLAKAWESGFFDNISPLDVQKRAEQEIPLDDVLKDWVVSTDPKVHLDAIRELADKGATHIVLHVASPNQQDAIDFFGREVLPTIQTGQLVTA